MRQRKKSILAMYHVTNRIRGMIYVWMDAAWISWGLAQRARKREGETEEERVHRGRWGGELNCCDYFYSVARFFFFPAAIIPFSSTAGHRESLQSVDSMMAQLPQSPDAMLTLRCTEKGIMMYGLQSFNLPVISTLRKASDGSTSASWRRVQLSNRIKKTKRSSTSFLRRPEGRASRRELSLPQDFLLETEFG